MNGTTSGNTGEATVLLSKEFLDSWLDLPRQAQKKTNAFVDQFRKNPQAPGYNFERVENADGRMYSARIDQKYRIILAYQKESGVYVLLHADNHDAAYQWAATRRIGVNRYNNALQVYDADIQRIDAATQRLDQDAPAPIGAEETPLPAGYAALTADDMLLFGVPDIYVPLMLRIRTKAKFDEWAGKLPDDARTYMQLIAEGQPKTEVMALLEDGQGSSDALGYERNIPSAKVETQPGAGEDDFRAALASYATQQNFVIVKGEDDLRRILNASLDKWRVFLHPSQRSYAERDCSGPFRLLGGAGTGKTVVAMHRAKHLAAKLIAAGSDRKVLFTTFSTTLATDIQANLCTICTSEEMRRIDVLNLDRFVGRFLKAHDLPYQVIYDNTAAGRGVGITIDEAWARARQAVGTPLAAQLATSFLKDEWSQIVIPRRIDSMAAYLRTPRRGRGTRLSRAQKLAVWETMDAYRQIMRSHGVCDIDAAMDMVGRLLEQSHGQGEYAHVIVDEGQDFSAPAYRILRALVEKHPNDMFIVGDARQRIYGRTVVLSHCDIDIRGRARRLKINYRTTEQIRQAADHIFDTSGPDVVDAAFDAVRGLAADDGTPVVFDDLNGQDDASGNDSRSLVSGPRPTARRFATQREEMAFVKDWLRGECLAGPDEGTDEGPAETSGTSAKVDPRDICVVVRNRDLATRWAAELDGQSYGSCLLQRDQTDDRRKDGVRVATMHRVKGLEFDYVILADVDDGICPPRLALENAADEVARREVRKEERSLIYVALTRARKGAMLLGCGAPLAD